jgi:predicted nucleotidyltransferase
VHPASDIDLAVIAKEERSKSKIEALFQAIDAKVSREFGNTISVYLNTESEFKAKQSKGLAVIKNILKDYKLIYGKDFK